ncbi:hypothetical protein CEXT_359771 [Caerostris extrusa]|uniref:Secreted protein n=1 Tax=Caerostris extrusa TaxID=172846 RepID=A0AAV4MPE0_CAEEX|nr:hypothetical protein CEXT_359771 [Caerostris extrusa]
MEKEKTSRRKCPSALPAWPLPEKCLICMFFYSAFGNCFCADDCAVASRPNYKKTDLVSCGVKWIRKGKRKPLYLSKCFQRVIGLPDYFCRRI